MSRIQTAATYALMLTFGVPATAGGYSSAPAERPAVEPVAVQAFEGFYLGVEYGAVSGDGIEEVPLTTGASVTIPLNFNDGDASGFFTGYNMQSGKFVYGGELRRLAFDDFNYLSLEIDRATDVRGRIGFVAGEALFYGAVGWSWATIENTASGAEGDLDGANYGLGVEYNVNDRVFVGADYTARQLDGKYASTNNVDFDIDTVTFRLGLRF